MDNVRNLVMNNILKEEGCIVPSDKSDKSDKSDGSDKSDKSDGSDGSDKMAAAFFRSLVPGGLSPSGSGTAVSISRPPSQNFAH